MNSPFLFINFSFWKNATIKKQEYGHWKIFKNRIFFLFFHLILKNLPLAFPFFSIVVMIRKKTCFRHVWIIFSNSVFCPLIVFQNRIHSYTYKTIRRNLFSFPPAFPKMWNLCHTTMGITKTYSLRLPWGYTKIPCEMLSKRKEGS